MSFELPPSIYDQEMSVCHRFLSEEWFIVESIRFIKLHIPIGHTFGHVKDTHTCRKSRSHARETTRTLSSITSFSYVVFFPFSLAAKGQRLRLHPCTLEPLSNPGRRSK